MQKKHDLEKSLATNTIKIHQTGPIPKEKNVTKLNLEQ